MFPTRRMSNGDKLGPKDADPSMTEDQITDAVRGQFNREGRSHDNLNGEHFEEFGPEQTKATNGDQLELWEEALHISDLPQGYTRKQRAEQAMKHFTIIRK